MRFNFFFIAFNILLVFNGIAQSQCDSLYVCHGTIRYGETGVKYTGTVNCILHYRNIKVLPNIHKAIYEYSQHSWYSDSFDTIEYVHALGQIVNGLEHGRWLYYKGNTDSLIVECSYMKGKLSGTMYIYDNNGNIFEEDYKKGRRISITKCQRSRSSDGKESNAKRM